MSLLRKIEVELANRKQAAQGTREVGVYQQARHLWWKEIFSFASFAGILGDTGRFSAAGDDLLHSALLFIDRNTHVESGPDSNRAVGCEASTKFLDDSVADRQPQPRALPSRLGGEKGIKDSSHHSLRHSVSGISNVDDHFIVFLPGPYL